MASVANVRQIGTFLGASSGAKPTADDYEPTMHPVQWGVVAGSRLWQATFVSDLGAQGRRLRNLSITPSSTRQVEIWEIDPTAGADIRIKPLFWGELVGSQISLGPSGEQEVLTARSLRHHFGEPIKGQRVRGVDLEDHTIDIPLEFNPMVDAAIVFNRWKPTGTSEDWYYWIDPESTRTPEALKYQDFESDPDDPDAHSDNEEWDLLTMAETLCLIANEPETFVKNVAHGNYDAMIYDTPSIRNIVLKTGEYLPDYLDAITHRHGYNWTVDMIADPDDMPEMKPQIRFFKQQVGTSRTVKMQDVGEVISIAGTNVGGLQVAADLGTLSNLFTGNGALIEREMTIPLFRSWTTAEDGTEDHADPHNPIGRKWVANEGGDYCQRREENAEPTLFGTDWTVKRRVIEDCLTLRDGTRRPPYLEYRTGPDADILPVPTEWGWKVLPNEIGIYFTGQRDADSTSGGIPEEALTSTVEFFLTGTVRGDTRLTYTTEASIFSPNANTIEQVLDLSDRFFDRARMTGPYASTLTGDADIVDDAALLEAYVVKVRAESECADIQASITLFGLHFDDEYKVGDIITKVEGREISFNRSTSSESPQYVQIVSITHNNQVAQQSTVLAVSPHGVA